MYILFAFSYCKYDYFHRILENISFITDRILLYLVTCVSPYAITPNNTCVNVLIDFNNCGTVGNVCGVNDTSCSGGVCSGAPAVQLTSGSFIWTAAINGSVDDAYFGLTIPFSVTLYTTTTNYVSVTSNGVIVLFFLVNSKNV